MCRIYKEGGKSFAEGLEKNKDSSGDVKIRLESEACCSVANTQRRDETCGGRQASVWAQNGFLSLKRAAEGGITGTGGSQRTPRLGIRRSPVRWFHVHDGEEEPLRNHEGKVASFSLAAHAR